MAEKPGPRCGNGAPWAESWNVYHNRSARPRSLETRKGRGFPHSRSDGLRLSNWTQLLNPRKSNVFTDSRPEPNCERGGRPKVIGLSGSHAKRLAEVKPLANAQDLGTNTLLRAYWNFNIRRILRRMVNSLRSCLVIGGSRQKNVWDILLGIAIN